MSDPSIDWSKSGLQLVEPKYCLLSSACLLYYDYFLTFPSEVQLIWRCRWSPATGFFLVIRYGALLVITLGVAEAFYLGPSAMTARSCRALIDVILIMNGIHFAIISAFVALRISAIWSHNLYLGIFLFLLGLLNPSVLTPMLAFGFEALPGPPTLISCISYLPQDTNLLGPLILRYFPIVSSAVSIVYELLCLLLTMAKTFSLYREQQKVGISTRLTALLLHDGSLYFAVLTVLAVITIVAASIPPGSPICKSTMLLPEHSHPSSPLDSFWTSAQSITNEGSH
ncbi:uncharacterized protein TRAVEDRAFT_48227 [Trametes versicolor FP-101664 SS1]|uniref:uncharacterized protein n=1 Tax=Trametes versicolor (strain FP-101664) TaxID=717944 RepID=UPI00046213A4|nr:uncharacterized protein TRAVEDRAFT_48227 [Trametes versicolor FP-101664 SS1]EIW57177.1 hypothetical protein TRAVEDRAFT_48227 [Trametes versicolor FP-101664 SS1]